MNNGNTRSRVQSAKKRSLISRLGLFDQYNLAFILTSIIPLAILAYIVIKYVSPALIMAGAETTLVWLKILILFLLFLAVLGFFISRAATHETVDKVNQYNRKLKHLFEIAQSLSRQVHLDVLLQDIVKSAIEMTGASGGLVLLRNDDRSTMRFEVSMGTGAITVKEIPIGAGVAGWVAEHGETVVLNDVTSDSRYQGDLDILPNFNTSAILAAPLAIGPKNFGTLELLHRREDALVFTDEDASILRSLAGQASIFIENAQFRDDQQNYFIHVTEILLSSLEGTRTFWSDHLKNTARYSYLIGKKLNLPDNQMKTLHYAALLHDIGFVKINLRDGLSRKLIELHPEVGYEMIRPIILWKEVAPIIRYHHERYDGSGYPHNLQKDAIPLGARILSVAETFDVLTNRHSYRQETLGVEDAILELKAYSGTQFDPQIVQIMAEIATDLVLI
ncbi:GAF domain-containing protein [bacterium]|nr:GAF domain-containing protein [candidate division CSSED10-310 bacterium]